MSTFDLVLRVVHVLGACVWVGTAFFAAWFLMPALRDVGPDAGKVMMAVQKRGWTIVLPVLASLTVLSGFYLYRPYMGAEGNAALYLGYGGVIGTIALIVGAAVVSPSLAKATKLAGEMSSMSDPAAKAAAVTKANQLRMRALTFARIVSVLVILAAILMTIAMYV
jgi:uncharacterized membrane protein